MASKKKRSANAADTSDAPFQMQEWPAEQRERRAVAAIKPNPKNPKKHPQVQVEALAASYREFGVTGLILIDEKDTIIAGEGRWLAAKHAGITEVPVAVARGWSERKKLKYLFADNQLPLLGEFNETMRADLLRGLELKPDELAALGLDQERLLEQMAKQNAGKADPDAPAAPPRKTVITTGDLFILGEHRLFCGDATNVSQVEAVLDGNKADLTFTDPPYNVAYSGRGKNNLGKIKNDDLTAAEFERFLTAVMRSCSVAMREGACIYVCHGDSDTVSKVAFENAFASNFHKSATIIWVKQSAGMGWQDYRAQHEPILYGWKPGKRRHFYCGLRDKTTVWQIGRDAQSSYVHPTQKPVALAEEAIKNSTRRGGVVFEPFLGSGSTLIACEMTGRRALAMEIDPVYVHAAIERWETFTGQKAKLVSGETLDELKVKRGRRGNASSDSRKPVRRKRAVAAVAGPAAA